MFVAVVLLQLAANFKLMSSLNESKALTQESLSLADKNSVAFAEASEQVKTCKAELIKVREAGQKSFLNWIDCSRELATCQSEATDLESKMTLCCDAIQDPAHVEEEPRKGRKGLRWPPATTTSE